MIEEIASEFDGVVFIHPEWYLNSYCSDEEFVPKPRVYLNNLIGATKLAIRKDLSIFVIPDKKELLAQMPADLVSGWNILAAEGYCNPDLALNIISDEMQVPILSLNLICGGMLEGACVSSFAERASLSFYGPRAGFIKYTDQEQIATTKAKNGFVLTELCSDFI
tara:strand:+ start:419 stop:913 length:495 start_codon:yes stop_codon:yes gene_type:complete